MNKGMNSNYSNDNAIRTIKIRARKEAKKEKKKKTL